MNGETTGTKLSVVLPVYNVDPWLAVCLYSIEQQSFTQWECILVDDGSTDFSPVICDSYSRRDNRFKVIHQENSGVSAARNTGIEAATAPLLTFVDPDDFLSKDYFEELVTNLVRVNADVSTSLFCEVEEDGKEGKFWMSNRLDRIMRRSSAHELLNNHDVINAVCGNFFSCVSWGKVFRRGLWEDARFPVGVDLGEDMMTVPAVVIRAERAVFAQRATYYYRQRKKSLLHGTVSKDRYLKDLQASRKCWSSLNSMRPSASETLHC